MILGATITPFDAAAILIVLAAALGYINGRVLGLHQYGGRLGTDAHLFVLCSMLYRALTESICVR